MNRFLSYNGLPISAGGAHSINRKSDRANYGLTLDFLKLFSGRTIEKSIDLILYASEKKEYSTLPIISKLTLKFGIPRTRHDGLLRNWKWNLRESQIEEGFEMLKLNSDLTNNFVGPIVLSFYWNFYFKDPKTDRILPNQELIPEVDFRIKNSRIYLRLSKKSSISVWFALPFEKLESYELNFIKILKSNLPFKTSNKHWRFWNKSSSGNWEPRKIDIK